MQANDMRGRHVGRRSLPCPAVPTRAGAAAPRDLGVLLSALSLAGLSRPLAADGSAEDEAEAAARAWLRIVDEGRYGESWDEAAAVLKEVVTKRQWVQALEASRSALGGCPSRTRVSRKLVEALPGAPKGPYLVIRLETDFERKRGAVETITPALGEDGRWRVSAYFIE